MEKEKQDLLSKKEISKELEGDEVQIDKIVAVPASVFFPAPTYTGSSLINALNSIHVDSSFANRERIAHANGINPYTGTVSQNNQLLVLLRNGQLRRPAATGGVTNGSSGVTNANLNLRTGPGTHYPVMVIIPHGSTVTIHSVSGQWANITWNGRRGHSVVSGLNINTGGSGGSSGGGSSFFPRTPYTGSSLIHALNAIGVDSSFAHRTQIAHANGINPYSGTVAENNQLLVLLRNGQLRRPGSTGGGGGTGGGTQTAVTNANLNLRQGPGTNHTLIVTIPNGSTVTVNSINGDWANISWGSHRGYSVVAGLNMSSGGGAGGTGDFFPRPNFVGSSLIDALNSIGVDSSFANRLRIANANGISNYTGTAAQNQQLLNLLMNGQLRRPGSSGGSTGGGTQTAVTNANLNLRQGPGTNHNIIITIPNGSTVTVNSISGEWANISWGSHRGYSVVSGLNMTSGGGSGGSGGPGGDGIVIPPTGLPGRLIDSTRVSMRNPNYIPGTTAHSSPNRPFWHPLRPHSAIRRIVVHHTAGAQHTSRQNIEVHWRNLGWWNGGYHEMIHGNGDVELCYTPGVITNGVGGHNNDTYHLCYTGNSNINDRQMNALLARVNSARMALGLPVSAVFGHGEIAPSICPGMDMARFRSRLANFGHGGTANWGGGSVTPTPQPPTLPTDREILEAGTQAVGALVDFIGGEIAPHFPGVTVFTNHVPIPMKPGSLFRVEGFVKNSLETLAEISFKLKDGTVDPSSVVGFHNIKTMLLLINDKFETFDLSFVERIFGDLLPEGDVSVNIVWDDKELLPWLTISYSGKVKLANGFEVKTTVGVRATFNITGVKKTLFRNAQRFIKLSKTGKAMIIVAFKALKIIAVAVIVAGIFLGLLSSLNALFRQEGVGGYLDDSHTRE